MSEATRKAEHEAVRDAGLLVGVLDDVELDEGEHETGERAEDDERDGTCPKQGRIGFAGGSPGNASRGRANRWRRGARRAVRP